MISRQFDSRHFSAKHTMDAYGDPICDFPYSTIQLVYPADGTPENRELIRQSNAEFVQRAERFFNCLRASETPAAMEGLVKLTNAWQACDTSLCAEFEILNSGAHAVLRERTNKTGTQSVFLYIYFADDIRRVGDSPIARAPHLLNIARSMIGWDLLYNESTGKYVAQKRCELLTPTQLTLRAMLLETCRKELMSALQYDVSV